MSNPTHDDSGTSVTICGRTYNLRGSADGDYLRHLAELVDGRMREVAETTGTADSLKVAILAALNIADDYLQANGEPQGVPADASGERVARMITLLDEALAG